MDKYSDNQTSPNCQLKYDKVIKKKTRQKYTQGNIIWGQNPVYSARTPQSFCFSFYSCKRTTD